MASKHLTKLGKRSKGLPVIQPNAAGIDIGSTLIAVCVPEDRDETNVRLFGTCTEDLLDLAGWLKSCRIETVAMESTGVYWMSLYTILEEQGFEACLVNAHHFKNVKGKTDVNDARWLQRLHSVGVLRPSFRPDYQVRAVRAVNRHRDSVVQSAAQQVLLMQKAMIQMNLQLHNVISDVSGSTGIAIIEAILAGERDPHKLAAHRDRRIKAKEETIARSLVGRYLPEHLFELRQAYDSWRHFQGQIAQCDAELGKMLAEFDSRVDESTKPLAKVWPSKIKPKRNQIDLPDGHLRDRMYEIYGVNLTDIPGVGATAAHALFAEIGRDLEAFPTAGHFASWMGLCPNNKVSGGKQLSSGTAKVPSRVAAVLRMCALSLHNSKTWLGNYFRRMRSRLGAPKAITATAHKLARIVYHMIKTRQPYNETIFEEQNQRYEQQKLVRALAIVQGNGYQVLAVS